MKHVIIAGSSRSGKTTLSLRLREYSSLFNHYKMDSIKRGLDNNFYDGRIVYWKDASIKFARLYKRMIDENNTDIVNEKEYYVIDTCHLYPKDIYDMNLENTIIIFLGYSNITSDKKLENIRKYDFGTWTSSKDDDTLLNNINMDIEYSREAKKQCEELNIAFFDTSDNFNETLNDAYNYIINNL